MCSPVTVIEGEVWLNTLVPGENSDRVGLDALFCGLPGDFIEMDVGGGDDKGKVAPVGRFLTRMLGRRKCDRS